VREGWTGPGRKDGVISKLTPEDDALHIDLGRKGMYEWWYFDARLEGDYTVVVFFHASNPNPGIAGRTGIELVVVRPNGEKTQRFIEYDRSRFSASRDQPDVRVGDNYLKVDYSRGDLPVYEIHVDEDDLSFDLTYTSEVHGWKPGDGYSHFVDLGYFAWVVPFPRARVEGTVRVGDECIDARGVGYHDHNWLNFQFPRIIEHWMWGRIYSETLTVCYAFIQCNKKVDNHAVKVLMAARNEEVVLSTGEFDFVPEGFEYDDRPRHSYPKSLELRAPGEIDVSMNVKRVLEAEDLLENFPPLLRLLAKYVLRLKPGYFRLLSDFEIELMVGGEPRKEQGRTLHELVAFKPIT
jgi:Svf1-like C-terminal lipocalin-like domain